jgi:hypothetical protein
MPAPGLKADQPHFWSTNAAPAGRYGRYLKPRWARTTGWNSSCKHNLSARPATKASGGQRHLQSKAAPLLRTQSPGWPQHHPWGMRQHDVAPLPALHTIALPHLRCPGSLGAAVAAAADLGACSAAALPARLLFSPQGPNSDSANALCPWSLGCTLQAQRHMRNSVWSTAGTCMFKLKNRCAERHALAGEKPMSPFRFPPSFLCLRPLPPAMPPPPKPPASKPTHESEK